MVTYLDKWSKWSQQYQFHLLWPKIVNINLKWENCWKNLKNCKISKFVFYFCKMPNFMLIYHKIFLGQFPNKINVPPGLWWYYQLAPSNLGAPNHCSFFLGLILKKCFGVKPFNEKIANTTNFFGREIMFLGGNWLAAKNPHFYIADPRLLFFILLLIQ